jgi:glycosyltransferase involved in cell wall biosynthesis
MASPNKEHRAAAHPPVAIIGPVPPPLGGMALQGQALRDNLARECIPVVFVATNPPLRFGLANIKGIRTFLQTLVYLWRLVTVVRQVAVVHILAASYLYFFARVAPAVLIGRLWRRRVIVNYRGGEGFQFFARCGWLARPVLRYASLITVPSTFLERCFREQGFACVIVGNLINLDRFKFLRRRQLRPYLIVTRNLEPMYNVKMALQCFTLVKQEYADARIDVVGAGSQEPMLKSWVQENGIKDVFFHGAVANDEMPNYLARADILLNPTDVDNFPMNLLEAFASGLAVVSTNVGGIPDLVGDPSAALLVDAGDYHEMAKKVVGLLASPERAESLIAAARRLAERFTWDKLRGSLLEIYYPKRAAVSMPGAVESAQS